MGDPRHVLGMAAESATERWLIACGWTVIGRRIRTAGIGEIDLLALDPSHVLVAVEVRSRRTRRMGAAAGSLDSRRVGRLLRALATAAVAAGHRHRALRVDLVTVEPIPTDPGRWRLVRVPGVG